MIYRTAHQNNFSVRSNALLQDNTLSDPAYRLINHLLSLPPDWTIYPKQLMKHFGWSKDRTYKALKELRERGYAVLIRCRRSSIWKIYETPLVGQSDATPCAEIVDEPSNIETSKIPSIKNSCCADTLQSNNSFSTKNEITTTAAVTEDHSQPGEAVAVVVPFENEKLDDPIQKTEISSFKTPEPTPAVLPECDNSIPDNRLTDEVERLPIKQSQRKAAVNVLSGLTADQVMAILAVFSSALTKQKIGNPVGYLVGLKKAVLNDTLTAATAHQSLTSADRIAKEKKRREDDLQRHKVSNDAWAQSMIAKLGLDAFMKIAPWYTPKQATV